MLTDLHSALLVYLCSLFTLVQGVFWAWYARWLISRTHHLLQTTRAELELLLGAIERLETSARQQKEREG